MRQQTGLTQAQFAARLGLVFCTLNRWNHGQPTPSPLAMQKIEHHAQPLGDREREVLERFCK